MKIVLAPDTFKNSLTGFAFCNAVEAGLRAVCPEIDIIKLPLADGGDGTLEVVNHYLNATVIAVEVNNPFFKPVTASYLYAEVSKTAYIEMAEASGVKHVSPDALDCKNATTLGTGELILDAINQGAKTIILGLGGSATNDCGIGMATALGYRFLDKNKEAIRPVGANLGNIVSIETHNVHPKIKTVLFKVACDVTNPLFGKQGAAYVYAAQKGASISDIERLDRGLKSFAKIIKTVYNIDVQSVKGAGAAGGLGIGSLLFLKGTLEPGIDLIKNLADFDNQLESVDWIITGEGSLDAQTMSGKTIQGVLVSAQAKHIKVAAFCGAIHLKDDKARCYGIDYTDAVLNYAENLNDAMLHSYAYTKAMATTFAETKLRLSNR